VANAEFLYEAEELKLKKDEIYEEIKTAANQMTDLIDFPARALVSAQRHHSHPDANRSGNPPRH